MFGAKELTPDPHLCSVLQFESYKWDTEKMWGNKYESNMMQSQLFAWHNIFRDTRFGVQVRKEVDAAVLVNVVKLSQ